MITIENKGLFMFVYDSKEYINPDIKQVAVLDRVSGRYAIFTMDALEKDMEEEEFNTLSYDLFANGQHLSSAHHVIIIKEDSDE